MLNMPPKMSDFKKYKRCLIYNNEGSFFLYFAPIGLGAFRYVLLVGSNQDMYVPCHSALIQPCKDAQKDSSPFGEYKSAY